MDRRRMRALSAVVALALVGGAATIAGVGTGFSDPAPEVQDRAANSSVSTNIWPWRTAATGELDGTDFSTQVAAVSHTDVLTPESSIAVANLTVRPGQYVVRYAFEARLDSAWQRVELRCGVVDGNGTRSFLFDDPDPILPGRDWARYRADTTFSLPDITLGLRCIPSTTGFGSASFRNVELSVTKIPY